MKSTTASRRRDRTFLLLTIFAAIGLAALAPAIASGHRASGHSHAGRSHEGGDDGDHGNSHGDGETGRRYGYSRHYGSGSDDSEHGSSSDGAPRRSHEGRHSWHSQHSPDTAEHTASAGPRHITASTVHSSKGDDARHSPKKPAGGPSQPGPHQGHGAQSPPRPHALHRGGPTAVLVDAPTVVEGAAQAPTVVHGEGEVLAKAAAGSEPRHKARSIEASAPNTTRSAHRPENEFADMPPALPVTGLGLLSLALTGAALAGAGALGRRLLRA
jgi:hypothetical protein